MERLKQGAQSQAQQSQQQSQLSPNNGDNVNVPPTPYGSPANGGVMAMGPGPLPPISSGSPLFSGLMGKSESSRGESGRDATRSSGSGEGESGGGNGNGEQVSMQATGSGKSSRGRPVAVSVNTVVSGSGGNVANAAENHLTAFYAHVTGTPTKSTAPASSSNVEGVPMEFSGSHGSVSTAAATTSSTTPPPQNAATVVTLKPNLKATRGNTPTPTITTTTTPATTPTIDRKPSTMMALKPEGVAAPMSFAGTLTQAMKKKVTFTNSSKPMVQFSDSVEAWSPDSYGTESIVDGSFVEFDDDDDEEGEFELDDDEDREFYDEDGSGSENGDESDDTVDDTGRVIGKSRRSKGKGKPGVDNSDDVTIANLYPTIFASASKRVGNVTVKETPLMNPGVKIRDENTRTPAVYFPPQADATSEIATVVGNANDVARGLEALVKGDLVIAMHNFVARSQKEMGLVKGDIVSVHKRSGTWLYGTKITKPKEKDTSPTSQENSPTSSGGKLGFGLFKKGEKANANGDAGNGGGAAASVDVKPEMGWIPVAFVTKYALA
ncbi:hypothetical protein HDU76_004703 [Blyttiomyces sp. JEL0837]|nr:hypothetical protein HDU76_004703 [Blyttiomyces sp. JEL0837]